MHKIKTTPEHQSVVFYYTGSEQCEPGHDWKSVRDHYLFHYITRGHGRVRYGFTEQTLGPGDGFLFFPGDLSDYQADLGDPWHYLWCGFAGEGAPDLLGHLGLTIEQPIYSTRNSGLLTPKLSETVSELSTAQNYFRKMELLYRFFAYLDEFKQTPSIEATDYANTQNYIDAVYEYIKFNYSNKNVTIATMADRLGITRNYLATLVRRKTGKTPQELLHNYRMYKAREYLTTTEFPIADVASFVGYRDQLSFSKSFHCWAGSSPRECRKKAASQKYVPTVSSENDEVQNFLTNREPVIR